MFKAFVLDSHHVLPKFLPTIKSIEIIEGGSITPGCVLQTKIHDGERIKYLKNRFEGIDPLNLIGKFTVFEGDILGDKLEKISYVLKFEDAADGGCVVKEDTDYHGKGDYEVTEAELTAGKEHTVDLFKGCESYLLAHPHVCA